MDLNAPEFAGAKARALNQLLYELRALLPEIVKTKETLPYGKYEYNFRVSGRCYDLKFPCGHEYHATEDNWFQPRCPICGAEMETKVGTTSGWSRREKALPKRTLKLLFTGAKEVKG